MPIALCLVHGIVGSAIAPVAVHEQARRHQRVVYGSIEATPHRFGRFDLEDAERIAPGRVGSAAHGIEIETGHLRVEIGNGVVLADRRERDRDDQFARVGRKVEHPDHGAPFDLRACPGVVLGRWREALVGNVLFGVVPGMAARCLREAHGEIKLPARRPAARFTEAGDSGVIAQAQARPRDLARVVVHARSQIDQKVGGLALRKRVAVHADALAGGQFGTYPVVGKGDRVVARLGLFVVMAEAREVAAAGMLDRTGFEMHLAGDRHDQHIAEIGVAGAGEVRVRKTEDGRIVVAVTGGPGVAFLARLELRVGAELDHAERDDRARKRVAVAARADERIDRGECAFSRLGRSRMGASTAQCSEAAEACPNQRV